MPWKGWKQVQMRLSRAAPTPLTAWCWRKKVEPSLVPPNWKPGSTAVVWSTTTFGLRWIGRFEQNKLSGVSAWVLQCIRSGCGESTTVRVESAWLHYWNCLPEHKKRARRRYMQRAIWLGSRETTSRHEYCTKSN